MSPLSDMLQRVAGCDLEGCRLDDVFLADTLSKRSVIRPTSLGLSDSKAIRSLMVLKLETPIRVGTTYSGGVNVIKRVRAK
jgi:hypothetical protein